MSDPAPDIIDAIFAAFDPDGAGTTKISKLTGWPISTIHSWKGCGEPHIPHYRRTELVRAGYEAHIRCPNEYREPVEFTPAMLDYLDPDRKVLQQQSAADVNKGKTPQGEAEKGATLAGDHAERTESGWAAKAYGFLQSYATPNRRFLAEDVRLASVSAGVPVPPAPGAWGNVFKRAAKKGLIAKVGYEASKLASTHGKAAVVWVAR